MYREEDSALGAVAGFVLSLTTISLIFLYAAWFFGAAAERRPAHWKITWGFPNLVYLLTVLLSVLAASVPFLALCDVFLLIQAYAMFFYLANRVRTYEDVVFCLLALAFSMCVESLIIVGLFSLGSGALGEEYALGPITFMVAPDGRIAGTLRSPVLAGCLIAILWLPVMALNLTTPSWRVWLATAIALILGMLGLLLTQTRGAVLTVGIGSIIIGVGLLLRGWLPKWALGSAIVLAMLGAYPMFVIVQKRVIGDDEGSAEARTHHSKIAFETIEKQPIFGYGAGNCHLACKQVADSGRYRSEWYFTIHCKYLLVWIETGLVGLIAFVFVLGNGLRQGVLAWRGRHRYLSPLGLACAAALAGHMVHMLVDVFNSRPQVQTLWTILGVTAAIYQMTRSHDGTPTARRGGLTRVA